MALIFLEHYVTLFNDDNDMNTKEEYLDQVWDLLQQAYAAISGMANMKDKEELLDDNLIWKLVTKNKKVLAVEIYKNKDNSRKMVLGGCLPTPEGKEAFYKLASENVKRMERNTWAEVSGSMEGVYLFKLGATPIPVDIASEILNDMGKDVLDTDKDGFHYTRMIGGKPYEKIMFGNVPEKYRTKNWNDSSKDYKDRFQTYAKEHPDEIENRKNKHRNKK